MSVRPLKALARAVAVAAALSALLIGGAATAASATPTVSVDPDRTGSISVHKFRTPPTGPSDDASTGKPMDGTGLNPIGGVTFTFERLTDYNLTTNAGWESLSGLTAPQAAGKNKVVAATVTTNRDGLAVAADLPLGVYLVTETGYPGYVVPSKPFLITVPMTDPDDRNTWMYDVHVYPKNQVLGATKTVEDMPSISVGDPVMWTITADIPAVDTIHGYRIVDPLEARLSYDHEGSPARLGLVNAGGFALVGGDYTVVSAVVDGRVTVTAEFTAAGLAKLVQAKKAFPAAQVELVVPTTVNAIGDGNIENYAEVYPNEPAPTRVRGLPRDGIVTPPVSTKWGKISILKVDGEERPLAGADFQVFMSKADALALVNPIPVGGVRTFTTDVNGVVEINGLRQTGWANGAPVVEGDPGWRPYWVIETKAPEGYELLAEPIYVEVVAPADQGVIKVVNTRYNGGSHLPYTGTEINPFLLFSAGTAILLGTALMLARYRRKAVVSTT